MKRIISENLTPEEAKTLWKYLDDACYLIAEHRSISYSILYFQLNNYPFRIYITMLINWF